MSWQKSVCWKQQSHVGGNTFNKHTLTYISTSGHKAPNNPPQILTFHILLVDGIECNNILCCKLEILLIPNPPTTHIVRNCFLVM
jgi:hypothetical protein